MIHIELEDGVPDDRKDDARESARAALAEITWEGCEVWVRINVPGSDDAAHDIAALAGAAPDAFLIPKVNGPQVSRTSPRSSPRPSAPTACPTAGSRSRP